MRVDLTKFLKDPLAHFVLLGAAIFVAFALLEDEPGADERQIVIPEAEIDGLWGAMSMIYGRAPSEAEIEQLIEPRIREEVLYREALALGLDRDDSQVRQRLVEKMTFLSEDLLPAEPPSDEEVAAFFEANRETFIEPARVDFEQLYFSPSAHGDGIIAAAEDALEALAGGADPDTLGDSSTVPRVREAATAEALSADLGEEYATGVLALADDGAWHGPIRSFFGVHLVRVTARTEARTPALEEIRERVVLALNAERRRDVNEQAYQDLRERYDIVIEIPDAVREAWQSE
jgi:hypothetical protein